MVSVAQEFRKDLTIGADYNCSQSGNSEELEQLRAGQALFFLVVSEFLLILHCVLV